MQMSSRIQPQPHQVEVVEIRHKMLDEQARLEAYKTIFNHAITIESLRRFDDLSAHFHILLDKQPIGGYRLTPLGSKLSEVEEVFADFPFALPSVEIGRLWLRKEYMNMRLTPFALNSMMHHLKLHDRQGYFKSELVLGKHMMKEHNGFDEGCTGYNPTLKYYCHLYSLGVKAELTITGGTVR